MFGKQETIVFAKSWHVIHRSNPSLSVCLNLHLDVFFHNWITSLGSSFRHKLPLGLSIDKKVHSFVVECSRACTELRLKITSYSHSVDSLTTLPWRIKLHASTVKVSILVVFFPHHQVLPSKNSRPQYTITLRLPPVSNTTMSHDHLYAIRFQTSSTYTQSISRKQKRALHG